MNAKKMVGMSFWTLALVVPGVAQNRIHHYDGTTEATSRGVGGTAEKTLLQRLPGDQARGATALTGMQFIVQDQNVATTESLTLEVRTNNSAGPATGSPDMSAAGLLFQGTISNIQFTAGFALLVTVTMDGQGGNPPPVILPAAGSGASGDFYLALRFAPQPLWTADGISLWTSGAIGANAGEQMNPGAVGYTGVAGAAGLAWDYNNTTTALALAASNRAWNLAGFYMEDTLQPFANNPTAFTGAGGNGANPNFGYAGMFPHMARSVGADGVGWRAQSSQPVGAATVLLLSSGLSSTPVTLPSGLATPNAAALHLDLSNSISTLSIATVAPPPSELATSQVVFGPFAGSPALAGAGNLYAQLISLSGGLFGVSTACRTNL